MKRFLGEMKNVKWEGFRIEWWMEKLKDICVEEDIPKVEILIVNVRSLSNHTYVNNIFDKQLI